MRQKRAKDKRINARKKAHGRQTRQRARKPAQKRQNTKAGNKAAGRRTCGKPHAQPPGGGTSLHPGAASQTGQTAAAKAPHTQAHGRQTANRPRQRRPDAKAADCPRAGKQSRGTRAHLREASHTAAGAAAGKTRRGTGRKSPHNSGKPRKNGQPGTWRGAPGAEKKLRTGKIRIRSFACPEGPCEPEPPKNRFTVFGRHGLFCCALLLKRAFCCALRAAHRTKGGAAPLNPAAF